MKVKTEQKIRWPPPLKQLQDEGLNQHGWIILITGDTAWEITNWHSYDDLGGNIETLTIERDGETKEIYSTDEGETFTLELREN